MKMRNSRRTAKALSCGLGHRQTSILQGLHIVVVSCQNQWFIPQVMPHAFPLTNQYHSLLSCTILLACLTSKPLFLKQSFMVSIHLFHGLPTETKCTLPYIDPFSYPVILHSLHITPNHQKTPSSVLSSTSFITPHNSPIHGFGT